MDNKTAEKLIFTLERIVYHLNLIGETNDRCANNLYNLQERISVDVINAPDLNTKILPSD